MPVVTRPTPLSALLTFSSLPTDGAAGCRTSITYDDWQRWRAERQAINAIVQGFASNITKLAMIDLHSTLQEYPAQMLVQVHDEIVVRV